MLTLFRSVLKRSLGGWCAEDSDKDPFLQVDLVNTTIVTAVATQGLPGNGNLALRFKLNYSCDGKVWFEYQQGQVTVPDFRASMKFFTNLEIFVQK